MKAVGHGPAILGFALLGLLHGCAGLISVQPPGSETTERMTRAEFRDYTEAVFRLHNRVANRAMMEIADLEFEDPVRFERLDDLEAAMLEACRSLNRVVAERALGGDDAPTLWAMRSFPAEVAACHERSLALEAALNP